MRSVDPDYWVKQAVAQAEPGGLYVISDLRYINEAESLKRSGATVVTVRINRFESSPSNDPSERDLDNYNFDYTVQNKATVEDLLETVNEIVIEAGIVIKDRSQAV